MQRRLKLLFRPTVRFRLTLLYGGLFLVAGAVLLALTYVLLYRALSPPPRPGPGGQGGPPAGETAPDDRGGPGPLFEATPDTAGQPEERTIEEQIEDVRREERESALRQVQIQAGLALLFTSAGAIALGWVVAGRVLRPIRQITGHARHASEATLSERIGLRGPPDELKELADTIDGMLGRLQAAFDAQRRFAAQASHELRTPLAIIRAEADVALATPDTTDRERQLAEAVRTAADRSERLVDGLLALARSESTLRDDTTFDLAELVGDVVGEQARAADAVGVAIDLELGSAVVSGDRALLGRLAGNLVENAIRYNQRGGWVRVGVDTEGETAVLRVANSGPVVARNEVGALFEPFRRGSGDRPDRPRGFGLGLAIVRSVAAVHGGEVTATAPVEGGLMVVVQLPAGTRAAREPHR